ncbi:hypothetical protein WKV44_06720 [Spirochaetia bacterium 38H-sp]|uniref:SMODS and SLOG-associating 2TM effector domain-containing protein n=1 Tax=Rarispira pelagica TaxID=3141764 RepID=A0ABU9UC32_9SPIR
MQDIIAKIYDYDAETDSYIIKLSFDKYLDIFNSIDHYPIRKRDISDPVLTYIEECSEDIPFKSNIRIEIAIKREARNSELEERTIKGIKNYFKYMLFFYRKKSKSVANTSIIYFLLFGLFGFISFYTESLRLDINRIFLKMILEGLSIGSWVFLWEAIVGIAIENRENRFYVKTYKRLLDSTLVFKYE